MLSPGLGMLYEQSMVWGYVRYDNPANFKAQSWA